MNPVSRSGVLIALACLFAVPSLPRAQTQQPRNELDAFMEKVLARRALNRQTLNDYILDEVEGFEVLGPGRSPFIRTKREFTWYVRDGMHVRSPVKFDGVAVNETDRQKYEEDWIRREKGRRERQAKKEREKGEVAIGSGGVRIETGGAPVPTEPRFVSEAYFMDFKFEPGNYYLGNFLNYLTLPPPTWQANHAYNVGDAVFPTGTSGSSYICTQAGTSGAAQPAWPGTTGTLVTDGTVVWTLASSSILSMVETTINQVAAAVRNTVNVGLMVFGNNNHGALVLQPVRDISIASGSGPANFTSLTNSVNGITLLGANSQPVNESLWDAGVYFRGQNSSAQEKISSDTASYPSPIQYTCQKSFIIVLTTGNTPDTTHTSQHLTDLNANGTAGDAIDAAIYNYMTDNSSSLANIQRIQTTIVQLLSVEVPILHQAATAGHGDYFNVWNSTQLAQALYDAMSNIVLQTDTSFVAPVVPVSPENRTYSGTRVYMGFFKPISNTYWHGNLKKYGINNQNFLTDSTGALATYADLNGDGIDDSDGTTLPIGAINGSFRPSATSFWSTSQDGGAVESGGAGQVLLNRNFTVDSGGSNPRKIYTYLGNSTDLTNTGAATSNAFTVANANLTAAMLGVATAADRSKLINFVHGLDSSDENNNLSTTEKRGWIFGDILHSRPLIVNYANYTFTSSNESTCGDFSNPAEPNTNKTMIFVGSNDGMLHAINDCDGSEAWAFIPPDMLGNLKGMLTTAHTYFADATPSVYVYDANNDGNINTANGDKVILVFGERRGGGADSAPTSGSYYALDVSNPTTPRLLWTISNQTAGFGELAETWSEPKLVKMKVNTVDKIVAFVGAGYDNVHEDSRFGNTQNFTNASSVIQTTDRGDGNVVSSPTGCSPMTTPACYPAASLTNPRGRGIYAIEIATLNATGVPSFAGSGTKIWGYTNANDTLMRYSIPGEIAAIDSNNDGYVDRLYVADTGGRVWRFNVGAGSGASVTSDPATWTGMRLFRLDAGSTKVVRKFFYKPSVVMETGYTMLFIGSGDREHPLNRDVNLIDRMYALKDRDQTVSLDESSLTDVTANQIQTTTDTSGATSIAGILSTLNSTYGWFIQLDQNAGEKVLAAPTVFNKVAYFTTYAPSTAVVTDPCQPGNLGTSRLYAVDYKTGASVLNYDTTNDGTSIANALATATPGQVLLRSDRSVTLGSGIPSGIVMLISPGGGLHALIGVGGVIAGQDPKKGGAVMPLYWRQK